jgi:tryptophan halogenase
MHFLPSYDTDTCNKLVNGIFDNIVDNVQAHYLVKREDTPFWKEVKYNLKLTPGLESLLEKWKNRMPIASDIQCPWSMFGPINYIPILYGLDWFDVEKIKHEYENYDYYDICEQNINNLNQEEQNSFIVGHKELIKMITNHGQNCR